MRDKGGRPLKFKSKRELEEKIDEYFESCFEPAIDKNGNAVLHPETGEIMIRQAKPFTMAGLASFLDIDRKTLLNYSKDDRFFPAVKRARDKVEAYVEEQLFRPQIAAGVIFNLKNNFKWKDNPDDNNQGVLDKLDEVLGKIDGSI